MTIVQTPILNSSLKIQILCGKIQTFSYTFPLKKNEDVNPTKASHGGMNLEHLTLVK